MMLELRPICENCEKSLPNDSGEAMICTFECTFCRDCVENVLFNVCPNCGGLEKRPVRPKELLAKYPARIEKLFAPVDERKFKLILEKYRAIEPFQR